MYSANIEDASSKNISTKIYIKNKSIIGITANISLILFLKKVFLLGRPRILAKLFLSDAVSGVAAKKRTIIHKTPQLAFVADTL